MAKKTDRKKEPVTGGKGKNMRTYSKAKKRKTSKASARSKR